MRWAGSAAAQRLGGAFTELTRHLFVSHGDVPLGPVVLTDGIPTDVEALGQVAEAGLRQDAEPGRLGVLGVLGGGIDANELGVLLAVGHLVDMPEEEHVHTIASPAR